MENIAYYNGEVKPITELKIPILDRAVYFGDGVYEVVYSINQKPFALEEHLNRFYSSLNLLKINFKMKKENLKDLILSLLKKQKSKNQIIYWQASRASGFREHVFPLEQNANLLITIREQKIKNMNKLKYNLIVEKDTRFLHCNIKTLNLIPSIMASEKAKQQNCDEAVLFREGEMVTECAHSNIAILKDGILKTAPANNLILPGVTRAHVIEICKNLKIPVLEQAFSLKELKQADEVIVLASGCLAMGVNSIQGQKVKNKDSANLKAIQEKYQQKVIECCGDFVD